MLNFNLPDSDPTRPVWKLFIMDRTAQRIVSPILKVNDLREQGVTLFLQFGLEREAVADVPAVYFVEPTTENIARICQDLKAGLYGSYYLNFTSHVSRDGLEQLAQASTLVHLKISQIYDQYLNYVSLEDSLFSLQVPSVFKCLSESDSIIADRIVSGLFSVCMSIGGSAPVLCAPKSTGNDLKQIVMTRLESKIRSHLINTKSALAMTSTTNSSTSRPLVIIADRMIDLAGPIRHSSAYNALIDDILGLQDNKVTLNAKSFDIDMRDTIWRENATKPFPSVAAAVESALKTYKTDYDRVMQTTPGMTEELMKTGNENSNALTPEQLRVAINVLPELTDRKRLIDTHLQISTALLDAIKARDLGNLFHLEQSIPSLSPGAFLNALRDPKCGNARDKVRLLIVYLLQSKVAVNMEEAIEACKNAGCSEADLAIVENINASSKSNNSALSVPSSPTVAPTSPTSLNEASIGDFLTRLSSGGGAVLGSLVSSVKQLLPVQSETPLTRLVDTCFQTVTGSNSSNASMNVPSSSASLNVSDPRPKSTVTSLHSIDHVILVILGGAAYSEYDQLLEHFGKARHLQSVAFTLGVTEMLNADGFFLQMEMK